MAGDPQPAELVRAHVSAFNERDLVGLLDGLSLEVVWQTGADTIVGRAEVGALIATAFDGLAPSLEIRSVVAGDAAAAVEMVEHYRYEGVDEVAAIAAFFAFEGPLIKRVKVSIARAARTHKSQATSTASARASLRLGGLGRAVAAALLL